MATEFKLLDADELLIARMSAPASSSSFVPLLKWRIRTKRVVRGRCSTSMTMSAGSSRSPTIAHAGRDRETLGGRPSERMEGHPLGAI